MRFPRSISSRTALSRMRRELRKSRETLASSLALAKAHLRVQAAVTSAIAERKPFLDACRDLMGATCEGFEWAFAAVWLFDGDKVRCAEVWSLPELRGTEFDSKTRAASFALGEGLPGRTWTAGRSEWVTDLAADPNFPRAPAALAAGLRSAFAVPLLFDGQVLAVIDFFSHMRREPDTDLLSLLATAGIQIGTEAFRAAAKLRAEAAESSEKTVRAQLQALLECVPAFILALDPFGKIQFINQTLSHHEKEKVIGSDWLQFIPPSDHARITSHLQTVLQQGIAQTYEVNIAGPTGENILFLSHLGPMREGGNILGAVLVAQDVTETRRVQAQLAAANRLATVGTLAAGVAHEINTPVQFVTDSLYFLREATEDIFGLLDQFQSLHGAIQKGESPVGASAIVSKSEADVDLPYIRENVPHAFDRCVDGLSRIATIVRAMRDFSHPDQSQEAPVDINRAVVATLTVARNEYKYVADIETELGELPPVLCHVNDINQVVLNLVVNAAHAIADTVKGTEKKGLVRIRTEQRGSNVVISVSDTGGGIPESVQPHIFEPFFTTKEVGRGTGQGLAIARSMVNEKHGGDLTFETKVGVGTTFFVRLPISGNVEFRKGES